MESGAKTVHIVVEEYESGSVNGVTYSILSVHETQQGADNAVAEWRAAHDDCFTQPLDEDRWEDGWCACGLGVTQDHETEVSR